MDEYTKLVSRILKNESLATAPHEMTRVESINTIKPTPLNLVTLDWKSRLMNDVAYQDCQFSTSRSKRPQSNPAATHYGDFKSSKEPLFNVTLVGYCRFVKPYGSKSSQATVLTIVNSEPLTQIARAVTRDLGPHIQFSDDFKFSFNNCGILGCNRCRSSFTAFRNMGITVEQLVQPCITKTKVFDGKYIFNRFHSQMVDMFKQSFIAILHLSIHTRYYYIDPKQPDQKLYRIGGTVQTILGMQESKLDLMETVNLGEFIMSDKDKEGSDSESKEEILGQDLEKSINTLSENNDQDLDDNLLAAIASEIPAVPSVEVDFFSMEKNHEVSLKRSQVEEAEIKTNKNTKKPRLNDNVSLKRPSIEESTVSIGEPDSKKMKY